MSKHPGAQRRHKLAGTPSVYVRALFSWPTVWSAARSSRCYAGGIAVISFTQSFEVRAWFCVEDRCVMILQD